MASITLKNVPEALVKRLKHRAVEERRSINQQALFLLEVALAHPAANQQAVKTDPYSQVEQWRALAGRWKSKKTAKQEIRELYRSRSRGRKVSW